MMHWYNDGWGNGGWIAMALMMVFWIGLIAVAAWAAVHFLNRDGSSTASSITTLTPRAILDQRLAAGEIDGEQYAELRRLIEGQSARTAPTATHVHP
jgi:uncharacterized membrane protein